MTTTPEETKGMQNILDKLNNAITKTDKVKTYIDESGEKVTRIERANVSPDAHEMYNILHKLQNATEDSAKNFVKESAVQGPSSNNNVPPSFGVGGLNVLLNKRKINGYKKTYYSITEDGSITVEDLALFESAMAIVKNKLENDENIQKTQRIIELDLQYASYLEEAASHKQRAKVITEAARHSIAMAKHSAAVDKMKQIKAQIKRFL
jgi:hypothetical protein